MKKIFFLISSLFTIIPFKINSVAKKLDKEKNKVDNVLELGKDIDKSNAKDSSGKYKHNISNFFVIGDSLSDVNGLTTFVEQRIKALKLNAELIIKGDAYGFYKDEKFFNCFSNGPTAAFLLAEKLGIKCLKPSNIYSEGVNGFGNSYAVAGATAGKLNTNSGAFLNDVRIDIQARALIQQHKINKNDLVFFEIGGNDLAYIVKLIQIGEDYTSYLEDATERIKIALFSLLNNGIKNILFMTPPPIDFPPIFQDIMSKKEYILIKEVILLATDQFHKNIIEVLELTNEHYKNCVHLFDLYKNTEFLKNKFYKTFWFKKKKLALEMINTSATNWEEVEVELTIGEQTRSINGVRDLISLLPELIFASKKANNKILIQINSAKFNDPINFDCYFFVDKLHPNKNVHYIVFKILYKKVKKIMKHSKNK
ncbi:SGNH/GDSL hydrolase family protein [Mesoplasma corruscae]|uniref:Lysophospholipase n=1 Tax=Mesoplasma corruscae TaxID=216874 RepID=A0A2S5RGC1_9MOLU|nr:SGNH/GDSL hydrolase family protein [Mesoplasma corruscae]PPE06338.1 lysophospholipase [Mesoplasma corruscae]